MAGTRTVTTWAEIFEHAILILTAPNDPACRDERDAAEGCLREIGQLLDGLDDDTRERLDRLRTHRFAERE